MNQNLPAACYMPILKESQRNFMILNIAEQESRMFVTAEHIPYMVCIEVFQPQEIHMLIQKEMNAQRPRAFEILNKPKIVDMDPKTLL